MPYILHCSWNILLTKSKTVFGSKISILGLSLPQFIKFVSWKSLTRFIDRLIYTSIILISCWACWDSSSESKLWMNILVHASGVFSSCEMNSTWSFFYCGILLLKVSASLSL